MSKTFSTYLKRIFFAIDILFISVFIFLFSGNLLLSLFLGVSWTIISLYTKYYDVHRFTKAPNIIASLIAQLLIFIISYFAYFSMFEEGKKIAQQGEAITYIICGITLLKFISQFLLRRYRMAGRNFRNIIILGGDNSLESITNLFQDKTHLGYRLQGYFSDINKTKNNYLGKLEDSYKYVLSNQIDEIYCCISELSPKDLKEVISFGNINNTTVKLIPDTKSVFSKRMNLNYYGNHPVLTPKKLPFENPLLKYLKRTFDIIFSLFVCITVLSWLYPLMAILIKSDTPGPTIFKQLRDGLNGKQFYCFKFRSMGVNKSADAIQATKNDMRVTKIGRIIRKTSIDELPQFLNVLKGDMSIVGPRPHMLKHTEEYSKLVQNYMTRNYVKPGITGLAQVKGCRGEIENISDIKNRVRWDIFYIHNWSFILDVKIITLTVLNAIRGEDNAY